MAVVGRALCCVTGQNPLQELVKEEDRLQDMQNWSGLVTVHTQILAIARSDSNWYLKRSFAYEQLKRWAEAEADIQSALQCLTQWQPSDERKKGRRLRVAHASLARITFAQAQTHAEFKRALGMCVRVPLCAVAWCCLRLVLLFFVYLFVFYHLPSDCLSVCGVVWCGL